jgi:glyoxylase-like metal-dependent hydrolase (beta-lactamase superfamily II)
MQRNINKPEGLRQPLFLLFIAIAGVFHGAQAEPVLKTQQLADNVYALIGPTTNRDPLNLGNNANFGVIVTAEGVVLVDPGGSYLGAQMIDEAVRAITDQPVRMVINTGGQDHRWLGNGYFKAQGARIVANEHAVTDQRARRRDQVNMLYNLVGEEGLAGTEAVYADETFGEQLALRVGDTRLELYHAGPAHTPGDSYVWLPDAGILFAGDIVYMDRMLNVGPQSEHLGWIGAFEAMAALEPRIVVGGHGAPGSLDKAYADTYNYLVFLRAAVQAFMDEGNGMEAIGSIDQSGFARLENFDSLSGRNAQRVYEELEWE